MKNDFRQRLHLEPQRGWLNDPNGLCFFNGEYHVYFQYSPDSAEGRGRKCWGHFKSPDLLKWEYTGIVLFPDTEYDKDGVYSGCGLVKGDTLYLFYTGNVKEEGEHNYITSGRGANVLLVTTKDGHNMSEKRLLLTNADYPEYCSCHVRDPKVWQEGGSYRMVLGARTLDNRGCVLYYTSEDLLCWKYERTIFGSDGSFMWECPDCFMLGGREILSVSPQGTEHRKYIYQNVYSSGYFTLKDGEPTDYREWDCGFDFYAPQSFLAPDGRRLLIGWEGIGDIPYTNATTEKGWQHCLTIPRELSIGDDGAVLQRPIREIKRLRCQGREVSDSKVYKTQLPFELKLEAKGEFKAELENILSLEYKGDEFALRFINDKAGSGRAARYARLSECREVHIIADASSVEIFLDGGRAVMSSRMYPEDTEVRLKIQGAQGSLYRLGEMEVRRDE